MRPGDAAYFSEFPAFQRRLADKMREWEPRRREKFAEAMGVLEPPVMSADVIDLYHLIRPHPPQVKGPDAAAMRIEREIATSPEWAAYLREKGPWILAFCGYEGGDPAVEAHSDLEMARAAFAEELAELRR